MKKIILSLESKNDLESSIIAGRFDKLKFELSHTVIIGDNGGLYALLNTVD